MAKQPANKLLSLLVDKRGRLQRLLSNLETRKNRALVDEIREALRAIGEAHG